MYFQENPEARQFLVLRAAREIDENLSKPRAIVIATPSSRAPYIITGALELFFQNYATGQPC